MIKLKKIKVEESKGMDMPSRSYSPPAFYTNDKQISEIKDWEQGAKYRLVIDVEMKSKTETDSGVDGSFDIVAYKEIEQKKSINDMTDKEFADYTSESLAAGKLL